MNIAIKADKNYYYYERERERESFIKLTVHIKNNDCVFMCPPFTLKLQYTITETT